MREVRPELSEWSTTLKTNEILADIFDMLAIINSNLIAVGSKKKAKKPKFYPRPGAKQNEQHFGSGALPPDELRNWIEEKRRAHGNG